jgi:serine/threonine protein phosphatase PrpC
MILIITKFWFTVRKKETRMRVTAGAYSDKGGRPQNEDAFLCAPHTSGGTTGSSVEFSGPVDAPLFFLVADGMGGHDAGDAASAFVVEKMRLAALEAANEKTVFDETSVEALVKSVHAALLKEGKEKGTPNMGSTLTGILLQKDAPCGFINAGDSRVYRLRGGFLQQLSRDDSLSDIIPGAAKNIITNAVGAGLTDISVASRFSPAIAIKGDVFLMCSDGVHGFLIDDKLGMFMGGTLSPAETAKRIVEAAIANNSDDNCTALVVRLDEE